jgi:hypothetical protein
MSDLRFDTGADEFGAPRVQQQGSDISTKLVEWGLVSNKQEATYVLIAATVLVLILSYFAYSYFSGGSEVPTEPVFSR